MNPLTLNNSMILNGAPRFVRPLESTKLVAMDRYHRCVATSGCYHIESPLATNGERAKYWSLATSGDRPIRSRSENN
jgi:hypothetical protein